MNIIYGVYIIPDHCGHKVYLNYTTTEEEAKKSVEKNKKHHSFVWFHALGVNNVGDKT